MKKFFVLVALLGVSAASFGCGGESKKAEPVAPPAPAEGDSTPEDDKTP